MPIYEFECPSCSKVSEFSLKMSEAYPADCPSCGATGLQKIMSRTAFVLQGGGWYNEAYSKKSAAAAPATATPASETPAAAPTATPAPAPTETKAAPAKTETKSS